MQELHSLLCGKLLGDGHLKLKCNTALLEFKHKASDASYLFLTKNILEKYPDCIKFGTNVPYPVTYVNENTGNVSVVLAVVSLTSEFLTDLYYIWYPEKEKIVPREYVLKYLDARALAYWYQDDGSLYGTTKITLSTDSFSADDIDFLICLLKDRFNVTAHKDGQNRIEITSRRNVMIFLSLVEKYLLGAMKRKYPFENEEKLCQKIVSLKMEKYEQEKQDEVVYHIRKYEVSETAYARIEGWDTVPFNSWLTRKMIKESIRVITNDYRINRILQVQKENDIFDEGKKIIKVKISDYNDKALSVIKEYTGIEKNEYLNILLKEEIPELDKFTVSQLAQETETKRTTINNYLARYPEYFPFEKITKRHYYSKVSVDVIKLLNKHKNQRSDKTREILEENFAFLHSNGKKE